jgi:hypothetical protein
MGSLLLIGLPMGGLRIRSLLVNSFSINSLQSDLTKAWQKQSSEAVHATLD